jgi:archaellin
MDGRAQSGIDRLALFVLAVLVVVFLAPLVLGLMGIDVRAPPQTTSDGDAGEPPKLVVLGADGTAIDDGRQSVGEVRLVVTRASSDRPVDLTGVVVTWSDSGVYTLVPAGSAGDGADGEFGISLARADRTGGSLSQSGDRGVLRFDLGTDNVAGVREFGERLRPGETATIRLTTADGRTTTTNVTVPKPLPDGDSVGL